MDPEEIRSVIEKNLPETGKYYYGYVCDERGALDHFASRTIVIPFLKKGVIVISRNRSGKELKKNIVPMTSSFFREILKDASEKDLKINYINMIGSGGRFIASGEIARNIHINEILQKIDDGMSPLSMTLTSESGMFSLKREGEFSSDRIELLTLFTTSIQRKMQKIISELREIGSREAFSIDSNVKANNAPGFKKRFEFHYGINSGVYMKSISGTALIYSDGKTTHGVPVGNYGLPFLIELHEYMERCI
ncbi:hypothetical protein [Caldiplasma sukawensis]